MTLLDIPDWAQVARSQPPNENDVLFRSVNWPSDWKTNAYVGGISEYAEGYRRAARILADNCIQRGRHADLLVYPVLFLYRHCVELQLKHLISVGAHLAAQPINDGCLLKHNLQELWNLAKPILLAVIPEISRAQIEGIGSYVRQLNEVDPDHASRYAVKKSGAPSIDKEKFPHFNIGVLADHMERLTNYLFGLCEMLNDTIQFKCEMEAESQGAYGECRE